jgi:K+-sensing histidine kinase KdpD
VGSLRKYRERCAFGAALLAPLALCAALIPVRGSFTNTAAALLLVALILAVAVVGNRVSGVTASLGAALWFDFFLTRPYERLAISHRPDIETTITLFIVGVVVTELAARSRYHHRVANEQSDYVAVIYDLAEMTAGTAPIDDVIASAVSALIELLHLRACRYETSTAGRRLARVEPDGEVVHAGLLWPVHQSGIPGPEAELLIRWRGQVMGRFVLTPTPGWPVSRERLVVANAIADQVGAAVINRLRIA